MAWLFYIRLIGLTAGTLVYLFLIALILGHRRPRLFERLLFFLILSLFAIYAGGLLEINAQIQYGSPPAATRLLYMLLTELGTILLLPLLVHTHVQYALTFQGVRAGPGLRACVWLAYLTAIAQAVGLVVISRRTGTGLGGALFGFEGQSLLVDYAICAALAGILQLSLVVRETSPRARVLGKWLFTVSFFLFAILLARIAHVGASPLMADLFATATIVGGILPGAMLVYYALRHNFLDYGAQRNLVYALSATVLALLYLGFVHRISGWLAPVFPPEATASVLLFILIFLFEPLERAIGPALHRTLRERMGRWQSLALELQEEARHGDLTLLIAHAERVIREEFGLAAVRLSIPRDPKQKPLEAPGGLGHVARIRLTKDGRDFGLLEAASTGSYLTGETTAALEFLAEQLPAMADLCLLIEEKLRLERELAERERLAMLGQMAASVSHNLRNPLSSMKTVLQVQLEKPDLPADVRHDCALVLDEIDRMSAKLRQLLNFAKPSANGRRVGAVALARQTAALFRHDAERRNVILEFDAPAEDVSVTASEEALSEVLSNLVLNAIEAQPNGGRVHVGLARTDDRLEICVEDRGPGISQELRAKIFQPFFTTKATGTGLGLAIVARRVDEMGGTLACESPLHDGKGTRFRVTLPLAESIR
ncbi:MAG: ATP-binding protein [Candidatus Acidiferrales bacterium]